jgi:recombination protein RecT
MTKELAKVNEFKRELNEVHMKKVQNFFGNDDRRALKFMSAVTYSMSKTPKLQKCTKESLLQAFLACAEYQLYPSNVAGEAFVIPYGDEAQFQLGYQGIITLLYRSGNVKAIYAEIVYKNDQFSCSLGIEQTLEHNVKDWFSDRGEPMGAYAVAVLQSGERLFKVMPKETIFKFREKSQSWKSDLKYKKKNSPWHPENDPDLMMWKKTALKQLAKLLPKNSEIFEAISRDTSADVTSSFVEVDDVTMLSPAEIDNLFAEGKGYGLSYDEIKAIFNEAKATLTEVTKEQAAQIRAKYESKKPAAIDPPPAEEEVEQPTPEKLVNPKKVGKLIERAEKVNVDTTGWLAKANKMTESEFNDLETMVRDEENKA